MLCELYSRCRAAYEICLEADFKSAALIYFSRAVSAYQQTVGNDRKAVYDLTQMCIELGDLYAELDDASGAYRCYLAGVKNAAALDNAEASERELYLMSSSKIKLGAHYEAEEQFDLAEKYYAEAYVYSVRIFHITKNKDDVYEVSHRLSELYAKQGGVLFVLKKLAALRKKIKI
jgi:tetratricopeptide (TPR) repeat protein